MITRRHKTYSFIHPANSRRTGSYKLPAAFMLLFFLFLSVHITTNAQVRATGHVFAEIVEPSSLTARATNEHFISKNEITESEDLVLAEVKLSGGSELNIDVLLETTALEAKNGERFFFDAFACPQCSENSNNLPASEKVFTLKGTPHNIRTNQSGQLEGRYRVTFMYN